MARIGEGYGLASHVLRVGWSGPAGAAGHLVVKLWSTDEVGGSGEVRFFRTFADRVTCPMPTCLLAELDLDAGRDVLVLEDLAHLEQGDSTTDLSLPRARSLVRGLAGLIGPLLDRVEGPNASALDRLTAAPHTLLHGDLHLDNALIDPTTDEVVLLDWAMVARVPAVIELAQTLFVMGQEDDRAALLTDYLDALAEHGVEVRRSAVEAELVAAVIVLFVTWTCAIARWKPATEREARIIDVGIARAV